MREDERIENPIEYMEYLAKTFLPLNRWGFVANYRTEKELIFNSEWCRACFVWGGWEMYTGYNLSIYYGRLHAPSGKEYMICNGEECRCWHPLFGTSPVLDYLDGLTPRDAAESTSERVWTQIGASELRQQRDKERLNDERLTLDIEMKMEAAIWDYYGLRLFGLFDKRRPELWERYRKWLREQYLIKGNSEEDDKRFGVRVPYYRVC